MASLLTNSSALTALQNLASTNRSLETTQGRISTGLRVGEAADNAAYWSIATTMRSDNKANSAVQDALGLGAGKIDTAYTAMNKAIEVVDKIKEKVVSAIGSSASDKEKIQSEIKVMIDQLSSTAKGANYAGSNLLASDTAGAAAGFSVVSSYDRASDGTVKVGKIDVDTSNLVLTKADGTAGGVLVDVMAIDVEAAADDAAIEAFLGTIETAMGKMANGAAELGAAKSRINMQKDFVSNLSDSIEKGVGQLVDADMNKESARLSALQVQQQLGVQALSIANSSSQSILSLFRG
ncbi:flagellin [Ochrobactrum sp. RC6B]|jgi:flagellin|uniref:Flagellin n=1 Tax=Brucella intermedia TaxID=94625 RepID=A0A6N6R7U7_9HYPH|nr:MULTISPECIES: flagellin [Brucella/Ochrobactrum group]PJR87351.1 flagellin [Ochrobactrum sp. 721/2009]PJT13538.1 flagellin [Ochrobactrum sp. 720/2009]PJT23083.1 flagellin [Ochrobactrum sp. 715/2009]PJT28907.1 flagellin [Ochrobactrum sp. 695/2009]PJT32411.1 flagellin [Ochrobactrum sp. 689/2009]